MEYRSKLAFVERLSQQSVEEALKTCKKRRQARRKRSRRQWRDSISELKHLRNRVKPRRWTHGDAGSLQSATKIASRRQEGKRLPRVADPKHTCWEKGSLRKVVRRWSRQRKINQHHDSKHSHKQCGRMETRARYRQFTRRRRKQAHGDTDDRSSALLGNSEEVIEEGPPPPPEGTMYTECCRGQSARTA